jgi:hypothetical protein
MHEFLNAASWFFIGFMLGYAFSPLISVMGKILNNAIDTTIEENKKNVK